MIRLVYLCLTLIAALLLTGCTFGMDNMASGGGKWTYSIHNPCCPPKCVPIGGNTGEVGNTTTDGGTSGTTHEQDH